jgi:hypothetical protein
MKTAVERLVEEINKLTGLTIAMDEPCVEEARVMEQQEKIEFACEVAKASAEKYIQGKTTWQIAEELLTKKQEQ